MPSDKLREDLPHPSSHLPRTRLDLIKGYKVHEKRTPSREVLLVTPSQTIGPFFPSQLLSSEETDLTRLDPSGPRAEGELIGVVGKIVDEDGSPVRGALIEVWQANKWGKYDHPADITEQPLDRNFKGYGRTLTDDQGRYRFLTIYPGAYPNPGYDDWYRPPHIHFSIFAAGLMQRVITQMYFPGEELNDIDPILNAVEDLEARAHLIASHEELTDAESGDVSRCFGFDIVLRGHNETPFAVE